MLIRKLIFSSNYDMHFVPDIPFARHAMAIDEYRRDLSVSLGADREPSRTATLKESHDFVRAWFAGNHSDIGGSYPENESRLSDIALKWMVDFIAKKYRMRLHVLQLTRLSNLNPSYDGMMHDELMVGHGPAHKIHFWPAGERKVDPKR